MIDAIKFISSYFILISFCHAYPLPNNDMTLSNVNEMKVDILLIKNGTMTILEDEESHKRQRSGRNTRGWANAYSSPITYKFIENSFMPEQYTSSANKRQLRKIFNQAFKVWEQSGDLRFIEVSNDRQAEIKISFQPRNHQAETGCRSTFDGSPGGRVLAHAHYPGVRHYEKRFNHNNLAGDLHLNAKVSWIYGRNEDNKLNNIYATNIFATAIHELGHSLGLDHIYNNRESIMYPLLHYKWNLEDAYLSVEDIDYVREIYGRQRNFFIRNWIAFVMFFVMMIVFVAYGILQRRSVIPNNKNWMTVHKGRSPARKYKPVGAFRKPIIDNDYD